LRVRALLVDLSSEVTIVIFNQITKLLSALEFVLVKPVLNQIDFALLSEDWGNELNSFDSIEFSLLEEGREVNKDGRSLTGNSGELLEFCNSLLVSEESSRGIGSDLSGSSVIAGDDSLTKVLKEDLISAREFVSLSKSESDSSNVRDMLAIVGDEADKIVRVNIERKERSSLVNYDHTVSLEVSGSKEYDLLTDSASEDESRSGELINEEVSESGDDEEESIFSDDLHNDGKIISKLGSV
jgi:hypothetical protein